MPGNYLFFFNDSTIASARELFVLLNGVASALEHFVLLNGVVSAFEHFVLLNGVVSAGLPGDPSDEPGRGGGGEHRRFVHRHKPHGRQCSRQVPLFLSIN